MRSLSLWKSNRISLSETDFSSSGEPVRITSLAVDLDQNALFLTSECPDALNDGEAHIDVWKLVQEDMDASMVGASTLLSLCDTLFNFLIGSVILGDKLQHPNHACDKSMVCGNLEEGACPIKP